jgi:hypothetical protein
MSGPSMRRERNSKSAAIMLVVRGAARRLGSLLAEQVEIEHLARDRRRGGAAVLPPFSTSRAMRDLRVVGGREGDEERVVAVLSFTRFSSYFSPCFMPITCAVPVLRGDRVGRAGAARAAVPPGWSRPTIAARTSARCSGLIATARPSRGDSRVSCVWSPAPPSAAADAPACRRWRASRRRGELQRRGEHVALADATLTVSPRYHFCLKRAASTPARARGPAARRRCRCRLGAEAERVRKRWIASMPSSVASP